MSIEQYSIDELMRVSTVAAFLVDKDSSQILYSFDDSGTYDVYRVYLETGLKKRETAFGENALICHTFDNGGFLFLMDDGHGFTRKANRIKAANTMLGFLENHL